MIKSQEHAEAVQKRRKDAGKHGVAAAVRRFLARNKKKASEFNLPKNVRLSKKKDKKVESEESTVRVIEAPKDEAAAA